MSPLLFRLKQEAEELALADEHSELGVLLVEICAAIQEMTNENKILSEINQVYKDGVRQAKNSFFRDSMDRLKETMEKVEVLEKKLKGLK